MNGRTHIGRTLAVLAAALLASAAAGPASAQQLPTGFPAACAPGEVQVMLLGVFHFAGSSSDAVRGQAEDVLSPRRQAELQELADRLARWAPDQIAVEWPFTFADSTSARFQRYAAAGGASDSRNEVVQVGFRLARQLGHPTVYPIDYPIALGSDSIEPLYTRRPDFQRRSDSMMSVLQREADSAVARRAGATLIELLRDTNTDEALHGGNSLGMFGALLPAGDGDNLAGPQLLARWYERNIVMAHNLTRVLRPGTRRVLVIVGSGHVPPLRNVLDESPDFCPVSPLPYLQ